MRYNANITLSTIAISASLLLACGRGEEPTPGPMNMTTAPADEDMDNATTPDDDMGGTTPVDEDDMGEAMEDMEPACQPSTQCPVDTCGVMDDGCGGALDCGACACEDGVPTATSCGVCGLGIPGCAGAGEPTCDTFALGEDSPPSFCGQIVYVSSAGVAATADGSKENPYPDIARAIDVATAPALVLVAPGTYTLEPLQMKDGVSVLGGVDGDYAFDASASPSLVFTARDVEQYVGIDAVEIASPTYLGHLTITTQDLTHTGATNNAIRAYRSSGLVLTNLTVNAGAGGAGVDGVEGVDGEAGGAGGDAGDAIRGALEERGGRTYNGASVGEDGVNPSCPQASGGAGGVGAHGSLNSSNGQSPATHDAEDGFDARLATRGGRAGLAGNPTGLDGQDGPVAMDGEDGASGAVTGQFIEGFYVQDGDGTDGAPGAAGHGGGGGGGTYWPTQDTSDHKFGEVPGGSGGGGGAGGCGGEGGTAGTQGGASIALLVVSSDGLSVIESAFNASVGGAGGASARGGRGGLGGRGGVGTTHYKITQSATTREAHPIAAGAGGNGASGGEGGEGGGGAGGASIGALCEASQVTFSGLVTFSATDGGDGGGGPNPGPDGVSERERGCMR